MIIVRPQKNRIELTAAVETLVLQ